MKNRMSLLVATILITGSLASGCYTVEANLPGTLRNDLKADQTESAGKVQIEKSHWWFLWGLVGAPPADVFSTELRQQVKSKGGDGVRGLVYESQEGCFDLFIGAITGGCIAPRTLKLSGEIVRIKTAPLPGKALATTSAAPADARVAQAY